MRGIAQADQAADPELAARLVTPGYKARSERAMKIRVEAFDWNRPRHGTPRFTESEIAEGLAPICKRIKSLEEENRILRARPDATSKGHEP
jgi:hypothetical protein